MREKHSKKEHIMNKFFTGLFSVFWLMGGCAVQNLVEPEPPEPPTPTPESHIIPVQREEPTEQEPLRNVRPPSNPGPITDENGVVWSCGSDWLRPSVGSYPLLENEKNVLEKYNCRAFSFESSSLCVPDQLLQLYYVCQKPVSFPEAQGACLDAGLLVATFNESLELGTDFFPELGSNHLLDWVVDTNTKSDLNKLFTYWIGYNDSQNVVRPYFFRYLKEARSTLPQNSVLLNTFSNRKFLIALSLGQSQQAEINNVSVWTAPDLETLTAANPFICTKKLFD
jgi:hypothetical protein